LCGLETSIRTNTLANISKLATLTVRILLLLAICLPTANADIKMYIKRVNSNFVEVLPCITLGECYRKWLHEDVRNTLYRQQTFEKVVIKNNGVIVWGREYKH